MKLMQQLLTSVLCWAAVPAWAAPPVLPELEQAVADRLAERQVPGEFVWLDAAGRPFLGLYLAAADVMPQGAVILVHGFGAHPDWPDVIAPLRRGLPEQGWSTLAIQLPRLSPEVTHAIEAELPRRSGPRIQAAVAWLAARGIAPVVVLGHGFGATVAARQLALSSRGVAAFVAVSMQVPTHLEKPAGFPESLAAVKAPVLDLYAANDDALVLLKAPERELWGRKNKERVFERLIMEDAAAGFHGRDGDLTRRIAAWLVGNASPADPVAPAPNARARTPAPTRGPPAP